MSKAAKPADTLAALYRDAVREHAANPVGYRHSIETTHRHEAYNALCGDRVEMRLRIEDADVAAAAFDGEACAICMASASLLCSLAPGAPVERLRQLGASLSAALGSSAGAPSPANHAAESVTDGDASRRSRISRLPQDAADLPEKLHPLLGVRPYPSRVRCATLPWEAAMRALDAPKHV